MSNPPDVKVIENHIKDLIFNNASASPPSPSNSGSKYKPPFSIDAKCLLTNVEDEVYKSNQAPPISLDCSSHKSYNSSQLIDLNVLTNFAARHADVTKDTISSVPRVLPHPDLENDLPTGPSMSVMTESYLENPDGTGKNRNNLQFCNIPEKSEGSGTFNKSVIGSKPADRMDGSSVDRKNQRKIRKSKKQSAKDKVNQKTTGENEKGVISPPTSSPRKDSAKQENSFSKDLSPSKRTTKTPEKIKKSPQKVGARQLQRDPNPSEKKEYSLILIKELKFMCYMCGFEGRSKESINRHLNSDPHKELKVQNEVDTMLPFLPKPLAIQAEAITKMLLKCHDEFGLSSEDMASREKVSFKLKEFTQKHMTDCSVEMIGSSITNLGLKRSHVDFVLKVAQEQSIPDCLELLYNTLHTDSEYYDVVSDFKKKRLGILFCDKETNLNGSIVLESGGHSEKFARLLSIYCQLDPRVLSLGTAFRYWANLCGIDTQDRGTLPAYSFSLLLVYFLQQIEPPVLPVVHEIKEYGNTDFTEKYVKEKKWKSENKDSIGELWIKLFHFYNFTYEMGKHVVCIRTSGKVFCSDKGWATKFYAIEDPILRRNIAHVIPNFQVCHYIKQCFVRTYRYFAYPQIKNSTVTILKNEDFEPLFDEYTIKESAKEDLPEESVTSDNEDSSLPDEFNFSQDFEDQDPELSIENVVLALKDMRVDETEGKIQDSEGSPERMDAPEKKSLPPKEVKRMREKCAKSEEIQNLQSACSWVCGNVEVNSESFTYKWSATTFKGKKDVPFSCKTCKSTGHTKKNCPIDDLPEPCKLPEMTSEFLRTLNKVLHYIRDKNCVDEDDKTYILNNMSHIEIHIQKVFPTATLTMFGSFCNGFGFKYRSDMDFCLTFKDKKDSKDLDATVVIEDLAKQLKLLPQLENIIPVTGAKVPIVKFTHTDSGLDGDISLYNTLAIANTEMLEAYSMIDPRVQIIGFALKYFAKVLGICDASRGSLSSYAYILMAIFFLQQRTPPVIPVLQEIYTEEKPTQMIDEWDVWFFKDLDKLPAIWPDYGKNKETVGELWLGLLSFYAFEFDWKEYVVSIRQKSLLTRFRKLWMTDQIAIEDPFELNHNLGAGLSRKMNMYILRAFVRGRERFGTPLSYDDLYNLNGHEVSFLFDRRFLNSGTEPPHDRGCRICGKIGHIAKNCNQEKACAVCKKVGHLAKSCPRKNKPKLKHTDRNNSEMHMQDNHVVGHSMRAQNPDMMRMNVLGSDLSAISDDRDGSRKLMQLGYPAHRHPPPGFSNFKPPPPGFNGKFPMHAPNGMNFRHPFPHSGPAPFSRTMPLNEPKHYSSSPPKNFPLNNMYPMSDQVPSIGMRPGFLPEPRMPPPESMRHRMWQTRLQMPPPNKQYPDRWKRTELSHNVPRREW